MTVTTSSRVSDKLEEKAISVAERYGLQYVPRQNRSLSYLLENIDQQIFVVNEARGLSYYEKDKSEAFFHPNMAFLRIKNMERGSGTVWSRSAVWARECHALTQLSVWRLTR